MGLKYTVYFDSCIVIYLVEEHPLYASIIEKILAETDVIVCHSPLTELESLVLPLRLGRGDMVRKFQRFFDKNRRLTIPDSVFLLAAKLRAHHSIKTPDALHLATAMHYGCAEFWTNDNHLAAVAPKLVVNVLKQNQP